MVVRLAGSSFVSLHGNPAPVADAALGGEFPPIPFDMHRYRTVFPQLWMRFLHQQFRSAYHAQMFFCVDSKTARDWWHGKVAPSAFMVAHAEAAFPGTARFLVAA